MTSFSQERPSFIAVLVALIVSSLLGGWMIKAALWDTERDVASYLIVTMIALSLAAHAYIFQLLWRTPSKINFTSDSIIISTYSEPQLEIPVAHIVGLQEMAIERGLVSVSYEVSGRIRSFLVHCQKVKLSDERAFGKFIEMILVNAPNITYLNIDRLINAKHGNWSAWAKEPDWTVLREAKGRVEANKESRG